MLVGLAIIKPWPTVIPGIGGAPSASASRQAGPDTPKATATPDIERALVSSFCLDPSGWRLFSSERWAGRRIRGWKVIEPASAADGPGDVRIPLVPEASRAVLTLGYCAPISGPDRPPGPTTTTIYRQVTDPAGSGGFGWETVVAPRIAPADTPSSLGGAWGPPGTTGRSADPSSGPANGWPSGTYVFGIQGAGGAGRTFERWFGVVVDVLPPPTR